MVFRRRLGSGWRRRRARSRSGVSLGLRVSPRVSLVLVLVDHGPTVAESPHEQRRRERRIRVAPTEYSSKTLPPLNLLLACKPRAPPRLAHPEPILERARGGPAMVLGRKRVHVRRVVPPLVCNPPGLATAVVIIVGRTRSRGQVQGLHGLVALHAAATATMAMAVAVTVAPTLDAWRARKRRAHTHTRDGNVRRARLARKTQFRLGFFVRGRRRAFSPHAIRGGQAACFLAVVPTPETVLPAERRPHLLVWPKRDGAHVARRARRPPRRVEHVVDLQRTRRGPALDGGLELGIEPRLRLVPLAVDKGLVDAPLPEFVLGGFGWGW
jgi:hypothetical protein